MNVSLSALLYSFMLSCLADSDVCPSMLPNTADMGWTKRNLDLHVITDQNALNIERSKNHTVHICTQGHKENPQGYQASWSFERRSAHGFLFLSVLEATARQHFLQIITPH
jgi:hypothetical protein